MKSARSAFLVLCGIAAAIALVGVAYDWWSSPLRVFFAAIVGGLPIVLLALLYGEEVRRIDTDPIESLVVFVVVSALCAVSSALAYEFILK